MFKKITFLTPVLSLLAFVGCQTSINKTCINLNWRSEGEAHALSGSSMNDSLNSLKLKCKSFASETELNNHQEGFDRGLAKLCTAQNGYDYGESGSEYKETCPEFRKKNFLTGYYRGRLEFLTSRLQKIEKLYHSSEERVWRKEREYAIVQNQDPERAKLEADVLESYREEARSLAQLAVQLKKDLVQTKKLHAESFF